MIILKKMEEFEKKRKPWNQVFDKKMANLTTNGTV
jgi:hypothetical protein